MKIIIAGSRTIGGPRAQNILAAFIDSTPFANRITEVVSGGAKGMDTVGEQWAKARNLPIKRFPADWTTYGKKAGYLRNKEMARYADGLIAVWDGKSAGTQHMIDLAQAFLMPYYVKILS